MSCSAFLGGAQGQGAEMGGGPAAEHSPPPSSPRQLPARPNPSSISKGQHPAPGSLCPASPQPHMWLLLVTPKWGQTPPPTANPLAAPRNRAPPVPSYLVGSDEAHEHGEEGGGGTGFGVLPEILHGRLVGLLRAETPQCGALGPGSGTPSPTASSQPLPPRHPPPCPPPALQLEPHRTRSLSHGAEV